MSWKTRGMNRDLSVSAFNPEFAFENRNLRLSTNENNTMLSWVNEKGTKEAVITYQYLNANNEWANGGSTIDGTIIGTAVFNEWLVLFSHSDSKDCIYKLKMAGEYSMEGICLFSGNLNFDNSHPIETLVSYESENIQKVYWTDKKNQPRVINIAADQETIKGWKSKVDCFDFVRTLQLQEEVYVKKILGASGVFPAGVIQYAFTYYDKYGQESNIFYTSPLLYTSHRDRGGSPEDKVDNAFQITVNKLDTSFDYLRIYSIMRTSVNGTPICRRVQDISIKDIKADANDIKKITYVDAGNVGDTIDPTELLYKGGESIVCGTIEQKDNTLFLGNLKITRSSISDGIKSVIQNTQIGTGTRSIWPTVISTDLYPYSNQLTSLRLDPSESRNSETNTLTPCGGFKCGDVYRLGIQFQYKTGVWSDPVWITDKQQNKRPKLSGNSVQIPCFTAYLDNSVSQALISDGYVRVRPVCVYPGVQDRKVLCQGVVNDTLYTSNHRYSNSLTGEIVEDSSDIETSSGESGSEGSATHTGRRARRRASSNQSAYPDGIGDLQAQSDWFFRPVFASVDDEKVVNSQGAVAPPSSPAYWESFPVSSVINGIDRFNYCEIQGIYADANRYKSRKDFLSLYSPDIEFDTQLSTLDFYDSEYLQVGSASFNRTLSDIDIQTDSATASAKGGGFVHRSFNCDGIYGVVSGAFYDDFIVAENDDKDFITLSEEKSSVKWLTYLWHRSGSLNNDMVRPSEKGTQTAKLKKKIVSNLRITTTDYADVNYSLKKSFKNYPQLFSSDDNTMIKVGNDIYRGNIDTILIPDDPGGLYFIGDDRTSISESFTKAFHTQGRFTASFTGHYYYVIGDTRDAGQGTGAQGIFTYAEEERPAVGTTHGWKHLYNISTSYSELINNRVGVSMKYKSTPHLAFKVNSVNDLIWSDSNSSISPFLPIVEVVQDPIKKFGGTSSDALQANVWLPCGEPKLLANNELIKWEYGDTYFQRWDCLKTYAFTIEDENQVVEIGSFMLETRTNIDGRYDKNRGQSSNLYINPRNFNLVNPVYSQQDNFFSYRILDSSFYKENTFPNQVTWSLTKQSGADIDLWTKVNLASILDLDGDKGKLNKIIRFNDQLLAFQDTGISQILYNENTQISTTEGVPIEIANSGKVQGKRYINNNVGCSNKWSIAASPAGIYFIDSNDRSLFMFNGQLSNLSTAGGFNTWSKKNITTSSMWTPDSFCNFVTYYDKQNQDVLFINRETALAFSEKMGAFTSFYDYGGSGYLCNIEDTSVWIKNDTANKLWIHQGGEYCNFFGEQKPYGMLLVGNPEPLTDKIFTNLEFRACVDGEGEFKIVDEGTENEHKEFSGKFFLPFDYLETWNEYQHGVAKLQWKNGDKLKETMRHHLLDNTAHLARKFRIWRCDIPRDNAETVNVFDYTFDDTFHNTRVGVRIDRMRNPWLYIKLKKDSDTDKRVEIHDIVMTYYN